MLLLYTRITPEPELLFQSARIYQAYEVHLKLFNVNGEHWEYPIALTSFAYLAYISAGIEI